MSVGKRRSECWTHFDFARGDVVDLEAYVKQADSIETAIEARAESAANKDGSERS
jgi:hypothetical protein